MPYSAPHRELTGGVQHQVAVSWSPVGCQDLTQGSIHMEVLPGGNPYYRAFTFSNAAQPLQAVEVHSGDKLGARRGPDACGLGSAGRALQYEDGR